MVYFGGAVQCSCAVVCFGGAESPGPCLLGGEIGVDERAVSRRPGVVYGVEGVNETGRAASIAGDEWARPVGRAGTLW